MSIHWFKIISPVLLCFVLHGALATRNDSLQTVLQTQLSKSDFEEDKEVLAYLDLCSKLYSESPTSALFYLNSLEQKLEEREIKTNRAYILKQKGTFYWLQGVYDAALKSWFQALELFEKNNNTIEVIKILNNIGETYKKQKDYTQSARFIKLAMSKLSKSDSFAPELILVNLGQLFLLKENYDSANYYLNLVVNKRGISEQSNGFASLYKGIIMREIGQYDSAQYFLDKSLVSWNKINYDRGIVESKIEISRMCIQQNNLPEANQYLEEAEELALENNTLDLLLRIYQVKIDLIKTIGSKDSLVYFFNQFLKTKDSIYNSESRAEINELSIQYDLAEREKESYKLALEQSQLTNQIEKRTQFLILLSVVLVFTIVFIFYLRRKSSQLKSAHTTLQQQKEEIEDQKERISSKSLALAKVNKELHSLNNNLEERVVERTKKLNERNRQIAKFTYYNSHKLRAPVANVLGLINVMELTKEGKIDPIVLSHLKTSSMELDKVIFNLKNLLELDEEVEPES